MFCVICDAHGHRDVDFMMHSGAPWKIHTRVAIKDEKNRNISVFSSCPLLTNKSLSLSFYVFVLSLHFLEFDACNHESIYLISPLILSANRSPTSSGILVKNFLKIIKILDHPHNV